VSVLKAGGAYVALDPADPAARLESILRDVQAPFVLAERGLAGRLPKGDWKVIPLDEAPLIFTKPMEMPADPRPEDLASISYVSGPAGRPLGVEITHANLLHLIRWHQRAFQITAADTASQLAPPGHEAALWEIWPYLAVGASLHFADAHAGSSVNLLREWLTDQYITMTFAPPALAERLMALDWPRRTALRYLLTGSDVLRQHPPAGLPFKVVNHHGQAETTIIATSGHVPVEPASLAVPPIGRPIDDVRAVILDENQHLVREGAPGELCLSGPCLARGYWNQPELTARKFIPDFFCADPRARLYRTGDIVRRLPDGQLAYCGRLDDQIIIRGFRVEPAEIENVLNTYREVSRSAVMTREDVPGDRRLVAYVIPADDAALSTDLLAESLRRELPVHMRPDAIVLLSEFPLTAEGKVDRAALPVPPLSSRTAERLTVETRLGRIMSSLIRARHIDFNANFLQMDVHPLMGALVLDRVRDVFGVTITSQQLYQAPTISGLAAAIDGQLHASARV
jgi:amino acid adenylation domain-containing protein